MSSTRIGGRRSLPSVLICLAASLALSGCWSGTGGIKDPPQPQIDAELLQKAAVELPPAASGKLQDLAENHRICTKRYHQVVTQCNALIDEVTPPALQPARWWQFWKEGWGSGGRK